MSSGPQFLDIIILFVIAVLLITRLRSVLGTHSEEDTTENKDDLKNNQCCSFFSEKESKIIDVAPVNENNNSITAKIIEKDTNFNEKEFINGAKIAFEMIVKSYAEGDIKTLEKLLDKDILKRFVKAIATRKENNETMECQLIGFNSVTIIATDLINKEARITTKFVSEQINIIKDNEGKVISGDANYIETITDIWTFARDITIKNPNWKLIATRSN